MHNKINETLRRGLDGVLPMFGLSVESHNYEKLDGHITGEEIVASLSIFGDIKGSVIFTFPVNVGKQLASKMMGGMEVVEFDAISESALTELVNMISGNLITELSREFVPGESRKYDLDISSPMCIIAEKAEKVDLVSSDSENYDWYRNIFEVSSVGQIDVLVSIKK